MKNIISALFILLLFCGCTLPEGSYISDKNYGEDYSQNITLEKRTPVVIVHGFLGSNLADARDGKSVWGRGALLDTVRPLSDLRISQLALPLIPGKCSHVKNDGLLEHFEVDCGLFDFGIYGYHALVNNLKKSGYRTECRKGTPPDLFIYDYDWRKDIADNGAGLARFLKEKQALYGKNPVKFNLLGHSMGGLVIRYFLAYGGKTLPADGSVPTPDWSGVPMARSVIFAGTPNCGYFDVWQELQEGLRYHALQRPLPAGLLGTFPAAYQMMCETAVDNIDLHDITVWEKYQWGILNPGQDKVLQILLPELKERKSRYEAAHAYLSRNLLRARQFHLAMRKTKQCPYLSYNIFIGNTVDTETSAEMGENGEICHISIADGDGKIPLESVELPGDIRTVIPCGHMGMFRNKVFMEKLLRILQKAE